MAIPTTQFDWNAEYRRCLSLADYEHSTDPQRRAGIEHSCETQTRIRAEEAHQHNIVVQAFNESERQVNESLVDITEVLNEGVASVELALEDAASSVEGVFAEALTQGLTQLDVVGQTILTNFRSLYEDIEARQADFDARALTFFRDNLEAERERLGSLASTIGSAQRNLASTIAAGFREEIETEQLAAQAIDRLNRDVTDAQQAAAGRIAEAIRSRPEGLPGLILSILELIFDTPAPPDSPQAAAAFTPPARFRPLSAQSAPLASVDQSARTAGDSPATPGAIGEDLPQSRPLTLFESALGEAFTVIGRMMARGSADIEILRQRSNFTTQWRLLELPDIVEAVRRGFMVRADGYDWARAAGYMDEAIDRAFDVTQEKAPVGEVLTWFFRRFIDEDELRNKLSALGWQETDIENIYRAAFPIPGIQDLISMAVREVFTPDVAERFGQYEDFPEQFADFAEQQGVSREWAQRYWAAHWNLPSPQMAFEMFQRELIDEGDLDKLLRALDIMPYWRDRLLGISYNLMTRVDIRRMHALGLMDGDEVEKRARHFGYSPDDAVMYRRFVETYNSDVSTLGSEAQRDLTTSQIVRAYSRGVFGQGMAVDALGDLGYSDQDAAILIATEDIKSELDRRDDEQSTIEALAGDGLISIDEAMQRLQSLQFDPEEIRLAIDKIGLRRLRNRKMPSKEDIGKMVKAKVINADQAAEALEALGYDEPWITRLIQSF